MFDLREFVMDTLLGMVDREADYKVRQYALGWYDKAQLTDEDMATLEDRLREAEAQRQVVAEVDAEETDE